MYDASYRPSDASMVVSGDHSVTDDPMYESAPHFLREDLCADVDSDTFGDPYAGYSDRGNFPNGMGSAFGGLPEGLVGAIGIGGSLLETGRNLFYQQRQCVQMGEGPTLLRFLCFVGGFAMVVSSVLSMINVFSLFTGPSTYVLQLYQGFFGIITMVIEAKDWDCLDQFKPWMVEWFRFLTVPAGKGAFYVFIGSLGISLWVRNFLAFTVGMYMASMGFICVAVHAGASRSKRASRGLPFATNIFSPVNCSRVGGHGCVPLVDDGDDDQDDDVEERIHVDMGPSRRADPAGRQARHNAVANAESPPSHFMSTGHGGYNNLHSASNSTASSPPRPHHSRLEVQEDSIYAGHDLRREMTTTTSATGSGGARFPSSEKHLGVPRSKDACGPGYQNAVGPRYPSSTASSVGNAMY